MYPISIIAPVLALLISILTPPAKFETAPVIINSANGESLTKEIIEILSCNCTVSQGGVSSPISALLGDESAGSFYSYGNPAASSANTGLEMSNTLVLFLYQDTTTGIVSFFLIVDIADDGSGGSMEFEVNCVPPGGYVSVSDEPGEFGGEPPLISGIWDWSSCCTDGGVISGMGCSNTFNVDLLISSGIDNIVWLSGDINDPTLINFNLTGEIITVNCGGGGICCPVDFDTGIDILDATCPDTPDGSIDLSPEDGVPPYNFNWSNGATTEDISGILPGIYTVTLTDDQGCTEELEITVDVSPGLPLSNPASIELCSEAAQGIFDLTTVENIVNAGSGNVVLWFENANMTGQINNPSSYQSGSATIYAVVDNGSCLSDAVPVTLTLFLSPSASTAVMNQCEEENGMATFDLTDLDDLVSSGTNTVLWYLDAGLTNPVPDPESFYTTSVIVYAIVTDGMCDSEPAEIELIVDPKPPADEVTEFACGDALNEAVFDLNAIGMEVSGGSGTVDWYLDQGLAFQITNTGAYQTVTTTIYAVVFDGVCYSDPTAIELVVNPAPTGNPITIDTCVSGTEMVLFNLWDYEIQVSGGNGGVDWWLDINFSDPVPDPQAFLTNSITIYASIDDGTCISQPVPIVLNVISGFTGNPATIETCADSNSMGSFDLTTVEDIVSGGIGNVEWFEDANGTIPILTPGTYSSSGSTVYAYFSNGECNSGFIPVELHIISSVMAMPVTVEACENGAGEAIFDLISFEQEIGNGTGSVNWFLDSLGTTPLASPGAFLSTDTTIFANVTSGECVSDLVPVELIVLPLPEVNSISIERCGDQDGMAVFNLLDAESLISGDTGIVTWYTNPGLNDEVPNPSAFYAGDSIVYATMTSENCISNPVPITLQIVESIVANSTTIEECIIGTDSTSIDLTTANADISGGSGTVIWYTDSLATDTISDPAEYITAGDTVYAQVISEGCISNLALVQLVISQSSMPIPVCVYSGIDSVSVTWTRVSDNYELSWLINGMVSGGPYSVQEEGFGVGGLEQGDSVIFWVTAIFDSICAPLTSSISCISEICSSQSLEFPGIASVYCRDEPFFIIETNPPGGQLNGNGISGDTLFPANVNGSSTVVTYSWEDPITGCHYEDSIIVQIEDPLLPPEVNCQSSTLSSVTFDWDSQSPQTGYYYSVNMDPGSVPLVTIEDSLLIDGLAEGDSVTLAVWSVGEATCGNSDTITVSCIAEQCPDAQLNIQDPGIICSEEEPILLEVVISGLPGTPTVRWSGQGITDPSGIFDPAMVSPGSVPVMVEVAYNGCDYSTIFNISVQQQPEAAFALQGVPCLDSVIRIVFTGNASESAQFDWDLSGGTLVAGEMPFDFYMQWLQPGEYDISLTIDDNGCLSGPVNLQVNIDAPLVMPQLYCLEEDYHTITVGWDPVPGAVDYIVSSSAGTGNVEGNTISLTQLPDDTTVIITVTATSNSSCGPTTSSIECRTPEYISPQSFIPNVFSPNGDGVNDILYIHANSEVRRVIAFQIYDRWGDLIFEDFNFEPNDPGHGWDGLFSEKQSPSGVFVYRAVLELTQGDPHVLSGDITLLR